MAEIRVEPARRSGTWIWILLLVIVAAGLVYYFYFMSR
jgi:Na+-transporting NADH:ubiquinone oxidoreductase subunit NqrB